MDECGIIGKGNVSGFHFYLLYNFKMGRFHGNEVKGQRSMTSKGSLSAIRVALNRPLLDQTCPTLRRTVRFTSYLPHL